MTMPALGPVRTAPTLEAAGNLLRARGLRLSAARRLVLEVLFAAARPVTADEIAAGLDGRLPRSDLASTYRNLEMLEEIGLVRHLHAGHAPGRYAVATATAAGYLACERCGRVDVVAPADADELRAEIRRRFGYDASFTHVPIAGTCPSCRELIPSEDLNAPE